MDTQLHAKIEFGLYVLLASFILGVIRGLLGIPSPRDIPPPKKESLLPLQPMLLDSGRSRVGQGVPQPRQLTDAREQSTPVL